MIRTSKHHFSSYINSGKEETLSLFVDECERMFNLILDDIWINGYKWSVENKEFEFNPRFKKLDTPKYIDYKKFSHHKTILSARALNSVTDKLCGVLSASIEKQRKRLYQLQKFKDNKVDKLSYSKLINKIKQNNVVKPNIKNFKVELSSKCAKIDDVDDRGFLVLSSLFNKDFSRKPLRIAIPIFNHKHSNRLKDKSIKRLGSFLVDKGSVDIRWELPEIPKKEQGIVVGVDQGYKDVVTLSNLQEIPKTCKHGHSLVSIIDRLSRKKKGSKSFKRSQDHRKNFINWTINQINLNNVNEIRLEEICNIGYKTSRSREISHWTNTLIRNKVEDVCQLNGVHFVEQTATYRSQRCSSCGNVRKSNRKSKIYNCKNCGLVIDADVNASLNHLADLPDVPYELRKMNLNRGNGFLWLENGFFDLNYGILEYPLKD